jgi:hypothetical protein
MKKLLVAIAAVLVSVSAFAQGSVQLNNRIVGVVDAPVSRPGGLGAGAGVTAELVLIGPGGSQTVLTPSTGFRTTSAAGAFYVNPIDITVPGVQAGQNATFILRAYEGASFATSSLRGESAPVTVSLGGTPPGGAPLPPAALAGLQGFQLVPEPSTIALGILGAAALLLRRRK